MPVGSNQPNVYLFEVGILSRTPAGDEVARTLAIHPLLVAPSQVSYSDPTRSTVMQTVGGGIDARGGRALRQVSLDGVFGVDDRRVGPFGGSGEERFQAFRAEVVRLGDAMTADQIRAAVGGDGAFDPRLSSPGLVEQLQVFDETRDLLFVNFYDFWDGEALQVQIARFAHSRSHRQGGATGLVHYQMTLQEVGPAIATNPVGISLPGLMDFLATWSNINRGLASYDPIDLAAGVVDTASFLGRQLVETTTMIEEVVTATAGALALMGGATGLSALQVASHPSAGAFLGLVERAITGFDAVVEATAAIPRPRTDRGAMSWEVPVLPAVEAGVEYDLAQVVQGALDDLHLQLAAGAFFGMDPAATYRAWVASDGLDGMGPAVGGTLSHVVTETDTEESIEIAYGVTWTMILALNGLTTDEAMVAGTELEIPLLRPAGPQGLDGLPTFGSHLGQAAWGIDLDFDFAADDDGDLVVVSGPDVLKQGVTILIEAFGTEILDALDAVPDSARPRFVARKLRGLLLSDPRIVSIAEVDIVEDDGGALAAVVRARALNGGSVLVGGTT